MALKSIDLLNGKNIDLTSKPGTYALIILNKSEKNIRIGKLGKFCFKKGYYIYIGSAMGAGGIRSRTARHMKRTKSKHWHIDYLRKFVDVAELWYHYGNKKMECEWAATFENLKGFEYPAKGFGSSDCKCYSHLIYSKKRPLFTPLKGD